MDRRNQLKTIPFDLLAGSSEQTFFFVADLESDLSHWSKPCVDYFGLPGEFIENTAEVWVQYIHPDDRHIFTEDIGRIFEGKSLHHDCEYRAKNKEGDYVWIQCQGIVRLNEKGKPGLFVGTMINLGNNSKFDFLTSLYSYFEFQKQAESFLGIKRENCDLEQEQYVFLFFNIENFKYYNSKYGYNEGDSFLRELSTILSNTFQQAVIGRESNDHFCVVTSAADYQQRIMHMHGAVRLLQRDVQMELKVGVYKLDDSSSMSQAHDRAKIACDSIKNNFSHVYCVYDEALKSKTVREKYILDNLNAAIENNDLAVYYQPIKRVYSDQVCALEALVRWIDPQLGVLAPDNFIPILERKHLVHKVDTFVIRRVCQDMKRAKDLGGKIVPVSVNLSRLDFQLMDVYAVITKTLEEYQIPPEFIHLEVTESALSDNVHILTETLRKLCDSGFEIWLDDFGSEYSTLNTLQNYQFDSIKLDMNFLKDFEENSKASTIIMAITDMAKRLHMRVLAEGIETKEQYEFLKKIGCDKIRVVIKTTCEPRVQGKLNTMRYTLEWKF